MRILIATISLIVLGAFLLMPDTPLSESVAAQAAPEKSPQRALLDQYCVTCHNQAIVNSPSVDGESLLIHLERCGKESRAIRIFFETIFLSPLLRPPEETSLAGATSLYSSIHGVHSPLAGVTIGHSI